MPGKRILILDGFRFIAITAVLFYHLTSPYVAHYPHTDFLFHVFKFGYLGVYFFFIISGFVINYTLENTSNLFSFLRNRFARLFPAMLLCSLITFLVAGLLTKPQDITEAHQVRNFLPSLTFTNPTLWTLFTGKTFHWINGSYWTLWVELQFYTLAAVIYYAGKRHFLRNFIMAAVLISVFKDFPNLAGAAHPRIIYWWRTSTEIFNLTFNICWFCFGIYFYQLFKGLPFGIRHLRSYGWLAIALCLAWDLHNFYENSRDMLVSCVLMCFLFLLMIYWKSALVCLENRVVTYIGKISYSIYLIHEVIGLLLINSYSRYLGHFAFLSPFLVILMAIVFAAVSFKFYESKIVEWLRRRLRSHVLNK